MYNIKSKPIRVSEQEHRAIKHMAIDLDISMRELVTMVMNEYMRVHGYVFTSNQND